MPHTPHDIYETKKRRSAHNELFRTNRKPSDELYWIAALKQKRRQTFIIGLVAFLIISMVVVITFQQYLLSNAPAYDPPPATAPAQPAPDARNLMNYLSVDADSQTRFLLEEIQEQSIGAAEITSGDKPLHPDWIKEAAYHLLRAERAQQEGMDDLAIESYENALRIYPDLRGVYATLGMLHMDRRDYEPAAAALERAALEEVMSFGVANNLGVAYLQLERLDQAEEYLLHALRLRPQYAAAHYNLATLYVREGRATDAAVHFQAFLDMEPDNLSALLAYASILIQLEEWTPAVEMLERAADLSPRSPPIYFRLAQSLAQVHRRADAMQALKNAVALVDARNALAWMSRHEFDALRHDPGFQQLARELAAAQR